MPEPASAIVSSDANIRIKGMPPTRESAAVDEVDDLSGLSRSDLANQWVLELRRIYAVAPRHGRSDYLRRAIVGSRVLREFTRRIYTEMEEQERCYRDF